MRLSSIALALFATLAATAPAPASVADDWISEYLLNLTADQPLEKRVQHTFLFTQGYIYADTTDRKLLRKVTHKCYSPSKDILLLFTTGSKCPGTLVELPLDVRS